MTVGSRVGLTVGGVALLDAVSLPFADVFGHWLKPFPRPDSWASAVAATLHGASWLAEGWHLLYTHAVWVEAYQAPWVVVAGMVAYSAAWAARRAGEPRAAGVATHGSARWRRPEEMRETMRPVRCAAPDAAGAVVGSDGRRAWVSRPEAGNPHVLLLGTPGSGKSRGVILPTIWTLGHAGDSLIVSDPKGELFQASAAFLRGRGYDVRLVDLVEPSRGARWNPLAAVRRAIEAGDMAEASARAWEIAHTFVFAGERPDAKGDFWSNAGEALLAALALGVAAEAPNGQANPVSMLRVLLELGGEGGGFLLDGWFHTLGPNHPAALAYANTKVAAGAEKARASVYMTVATHLRLFADPGIAWLTAESDHDPVTTGADPTAIFVCVPDESGVKHPIVSLYLSQTYAALVAAARDRAGGALARPVWFLLDEFGTIGRLSDIRNKVSAARSRKVRFLFVLQNLEQLDGLYGKDDAATVLGNCDTLIYLSTNSNVTAKTISDRIGHFTVKTTSLNTKPALGASISGTESTAARALLEPDEVMRLKPGQALVMQARQHAARMPLADLSKWDGAAEALVPAGMPESKGVAPVEGWVPDKRVILQFLLDKKAQAEKEMRDVARESQPHEEPGEYDEVEPEGTSPGRLRKPRG